LVKIKKRLLIRYNNWGFLRLSCCWRRFWLRKKNRGLWILFISSLWWFYG